MPKTWPVSTSTIVDIHGSYRVPFPVASFLNHRTKRSPRSSMTNRAGANKSTDGRATAAATTVITSRQDTPNALATSETARPAGHGVLEGFLQPSGGTGEAR